MIRRKVKGRNVRRKEKESSEEKEGYFKGEGMMKRKMKIIQMIIL